ncbi:MAG: pilus assembly protein N-terminal domain-containing protein, partial [Pseudomonadota bacterium]|nr:pilus assembly protein N-terminal domain-containing protein [Pseudomonadota bacterium]
PHPSATAARGTPTLAIAAGSGRVLQLSAAASNLFVADPKVAEARPASPTSVFVFGLAVGHNHDRGHGRRRQAGRPL